MPQRKSAGSAATQTRRRAFSASKGGLPEATRDLGDLVARRLRQLDAQRPARSVGEHQNANRWRQRQPEIEFDEAR